MKIQKSKAGFTLAEILIVLMVIGVLVTISLPRFSTMLEKFNAEEGKQAIWAIYTAEKHYYLENDAYVDDRTQLDVNLRLKNFEFFNDPEVIYISGSIKYFGKLTRVKAGVTLYSLLVIYDDSSNPENNGQMRCIPATAYPDICDKIGVKKADT